MASLFSVMASGLLQSTGDFLESELDQSCSDLHNNTDQSDDLRYLSYINDNNNNNNNNNL